jgi:hypothetical protein
MKKWVHELNKAFSKEDVQIGENHMKKNARTIGHKGNANQNHLKISPHPC